MTNIQSINPLHAKVIEQTREYKHKSELLYKVELKPVRIIIRPMGKRVAGRAWLREWKIEINELFLKQHTQEIIEETVPHEVAHLVASFLNPKDKQYHGWQWQEVMMRFNKKPVRCHTLTVDSLAEEYQ